MEAYKIYKLKKPYQEFKYAIEYFDPICGQYDTIYCANKREAKNFIKKLYYIKETEWTSHSHWRYSRP